MDIPQFIPAYEDEGRLTAQPWGQQQVEALTPEQEAAWITEVETSARQKRVAQARQAVEEAFDNPQKEQNNGQ